MTYPRDSHDGIPLPTWVRSVPKRDRDAYLETLLWNMAALYESELGRQAFAEPLETLNVVRSHCAAGKPGMPLPEWLSRVPADELYGERSRFLLRLAALFATPRMSLYGLSEVCGLHPQTIPNYAARRSLIPARVAIRLEKLLGRDRFPASFLAPEATAD